LQLDTLTILHVIRVPVEVVLFWLFLYKAIPEEMTFEGRNWDIISGITASVIFFLGFNRGKLWPSTILVWNLICLGLLVNIVATAILSTPYPFQRLVSNNRILRFFIFRLCGCHRL
jgi:hypothetical protein